MQICAMHYYYPPGFSGAAIQFHRHAQQFVARGHKVCVITPRIPGAALFEMMDGIKVVRVPVWSDTKAHKKASFMLSSSVELIKRRREFDLLHLHSFNKFYALPVWTAKALGKKVVYQMTLMGTEPRRGLGVVYALGLHSIDGFIALSNPLLQKVRESPVSEKPCAVIPYGIDTSLYCPASVAEKAVIRKTLGLEQKAWYISFVGYITERKGVDILVDVFRMVAEHHSDARLLLVGEDGVAPGYLIEPHEKPLFADELKVSIGRSGLSERVVFTGLTDRVVAYLRASDVFVFPSRREGLGAAVLEAMAVGLPCIISELDGISQDMIADGIDGYIISGSDPEDYARAIMTLVSNQEKAEELGHNARRAIEKNFKLPDIAERYLMYYRHLLDH